MKKILCSIILFGGVLFKAQAGINTITPKAMLHVVGDLQITKDLNVGGTATTLGDSGDVGEVLTSQGVGFPPAWKKFEEVNIPRESNLAVNTLVSSTYAGNTNSVVFFNTVPRSNLTFLTYDSITGKFTVKKAGYYMVTAYLRYLVSASAADGTAVTMFKKNGVKVVSSSSEYLTGTTSINHNLTKIELFAVGDVVSLEGTYSRSFSLGNSSFSFMYVGN